VSIVLIKTENTGISEWQILDGQYRNIISGDDFSPGDSVLFSLEAGNRYILSISVSDLTYQDTTLCSLLINEEPVIRVNSGLDPGDHFFPFYTGVKKEISKIIGGTDANIADFPWQVYFEAGTYLCGGTIIADDWIVTAAHCTRNEDGTAIPVSEMFIKAGATNPYQVNSGKIYFISQVIIHENFNNNNLDNDIALLKLKSPVDVVNASPIKLVTAADALEGATDPGVISWVTGWGLTDLSPEVLPYNLQKVQLPIVSREQASTVWRSISDNVIMAGYRDATRDACNGDSGGPLVVPVSGEYRLAGITSWGSEDCDTYSAYTRISAYESWIRTLTGITEFAPPIPIGAILICHGTAFSQYNTTPVAGATEYQWELFPGEAGTISGTGNSATAVWDPQYLGPATIKLRVKINNTLSEWSRLGVEVVQNTRIITQPEDRVLCAGQTIDLSITAEGHDLQFYRYKDGILTNTLDTGIYKITGSVTSNSGVYRCMITGSCGTVWSADVNITVHPQTRINSFSEDITINSGSDVKLEVGADGHELDYQWLKNNEIVQNSYQSALDLPDVNASDIGLYQVIVKGTCGTELSGKAYLYVRKENNTASPEVFIWPTVTDGIINTALRTDEAYSIRVYSYTGSIIKELSGCRYQTTIYMNNYPPGIYIINVYNRNFNLKQKFIRK